MSPGHEHDHGRPDLNRAFGIGIGLNFAFVLVEAFYGWKVDSLALLADAGHNLSEVMRSGQGDWGCSPASVPADPPEIAAPAADVVRQ